MTPSEVRNRLEAALALTGEGSSDFDLNPDVHLPPGRKLREAGVLVAVDVTGPEARVILTKRASHLRHHPGQVAFPGGRQDEGDADAIAAALREAREEIALPEAQVRVIGALPRHETVTSFAVTPVIGLVEQPFQPVPEAGEVAEIFSVPLSYLMEPASFRIEGRRWQGRRRRYFTVPYGPYYIWGATARILRGLADRWQRCG